MKKISLAAMILAALVAASCTGGKSAEKEMNIKEVLMARHSVRSFTDEQVSQEQLTEICWAANGVNRSGLKTMRTAPSAINAQDIDLYVLVNEGAYYYDYSMNDFKRVGSVDIRPEIAGRNTFIVGLPTILLVSNLSKFGEGVRASGNAERLALMDAGYVSENICLWCTANGLATVPCAPGFDENLVRSALNLTADQIPLIYHPVGYEAN